MRKITRSMLMIAMLMVLGTASSAPADEDLPNPDADTRSPQVTDETHPLYSTDGRWIGTIAIGFGGLFLAAMVIGPLVRSNEPEVVPEAMSHVEDPAADHH